MSDENLFPADGSRFECFSARICRQEADSLCKIGFPLWILIKLKIKASLKQFKTYFDGVADTHHALLYVDKATTDGLAQEMGQTFARLAAFLLSGAIP